MFNRRNEVGNVGHAAGPMGAIARLCLALVLFASMQLPVVAGGAHARVVSPIAASGASENCADSASGSPAPVKPGPGALHLCFACSACAIGNFALLPSAAVDMRVFSGASAPTRALISRFDVSMLGALGWSSRAPPSFS